LGLNPPAVLTAEHDLSKFACRHPDLATWLQRRALSSQEGAAKTYVVTEKGHSQVVAFYALAAGGLSRHAAPTAAWRRNMPDPLPVIVLGRLAVHRDWEGQGLGKGLLKDAVLRARQASEIIGARLLICHALDETAKQFYLRHGFQEALADSVLMVAASLR
jgi:GNAT superfamily N-acetyltransferase